MNIINCISRRAPNCISVTERAMELEQKPKCSSWVDESSYHGPVHVRLCHSIHTKLLQRQPYMYDCHIYIQTKKHILLMVIFNLTKKTISVLNTWRALLWITHAHYPIIVKSNILAVLMIMIIIIMNASIINFTLSPHPSDPSRFGGPATHHT